MPGLLRGASMEQRWQDLANFLSLQSSSHDPNGAGGIHQPIHPHHFPPHPYHHHHHHHPHHHPHHAPSPLHPHSMHASHFSSAVPPATPYATDPAARSVLLQNSTLPPPELNTAGPYVNVGMGEWPHKKFSHVFCTKRRSLNQRLSMTKYSIYFLWFAQVKCRLKKIQNHSYFILSLWK